MQTFQAHYTRKLAERRHAFAMLSRVPPRARLYLPRELVQGVLAQPTLFDMTSDAARVEAPRRDPLRWNSLCQQLFVNAGPTVFSNVEANGASPLRVRLRLGAHALFTLALPRCSPDEALGADETTGFTWFMGPRCVPGDAWRLTVRCVLMCWTSDGEALVELWVGCIFQDEFLAPRQHFTTFQRLAPGATLRAPAFAGTNVVVEVAH